MSSNDKKDDGPVKDAPFILSWRFTLSILGFLGFVHVYAQRVGMSVAIVCMVNQTALRLDKMSDAADKIALNGSDVFDAADRVTDLISVTNVTYDSHSEPSKCNAQLGSSDDVKNGPFVWSKEIQGHILGAFFYGYLVSQVPAGMLSERFGAKWVFAISFGLCTACTLLSPVAATLGYGYLIAMRVVAGVASGASYPSFHVLWSKWAPPMERSKLANICYAGSWMGNVIALPLSGYLCENGFSDGWPSVFYVIGISSAVWLVLWIIFASDTPSTHWKISAKEKDYILSSLKGQVSDAPRKSKIPWCSVLKSMPIWAITVAGIATDWGLYTFLTNIPTYMYEVLRFDMASNGFYSAVPFLGMWAVMNISPIIADKIRSTGTLPTGVTRKLFTCLGCLGAAAFLVGLSFVDCERPLVAVALLSLGVTISGSAYTGFFVNHMDIAPQFAGTLLGLSNGIAAATGFIAPYTVAVLTTNQTHKEWQNVFYLSAAIYVFGAVFYAIFAKGEIQDWAKDPVSDEDLELQNKLTAAQKDENEAVANGHAEKV